MRGVAETHRRLHAGRRMLRKQHWRALLQRKVAIHWPAMVQAAKPMQVLLLLREELVNGGMVLLLQIRRIAIAKSMTVARVDLEYSGALVMY